MKQVYLILAILALILAGCLEGGMDTPTVSDGIYMGHSVQRFIDGQAGVVCWTVSIGNGGGISCLPLSQTKLDVGE